MKKKLLWAFSIFLGISALMLGSSALTTLNQRNKVRQQQKEVSRVRERARQMTTRKNKLNPITYRNETGHIYYQTDSIWGKLVYQSAQRWNKKLGSEVLLASGTGQLVDLFITDSTFPMPKKMETPIYAELTLNHLAAINTGMVMQRKLTNHQVSHLVDAMFASALGAKILTGQMYGQNALKETITNKNMENIRKNLLVAQKKKTYNASLLPMKSELADHDFVNYQCGLLLLPLMQEDDMLDHHKLSRINTNAQTAIKSSNTKHEVSIQKISEAGKKMTDSLSGAYDTNKLSRKKIMKISHELRMKNSVTTIAGTKSSIIDDNGDN